MKWVRFVLGEAPSGELNTAALPIEIRSADLNLVARTTLDRAVSLSPGAYFVSAALPDGTAYSAPFSVDEDGPENETVTLTGEAVVWTPDAPQLAGSTFALDWNSYFDKFKKRTPSFKGAPKAAIKTSDVALRLYGGSLMDGYRLVQSPWQLSAESVSIPEAAQAYRLKLQLSPQDDVALVQLLQQGQQPQNLVYLQAIGPGADPLVYRTDAPGWQIGLIVQHEAARQLLQFRSRGYLQEAQTIANHAEELLYGKLNDPIAATVGAYALLRFGELDRLHDWPENLMNWFTWLPDGPAIRAEQLARLGEHHKAIELFAQIAQRGLPLFNTGFSYAIERLSTYVRVAERQFNPEILSLAQTCLEALTRYASFIDYQRTGLTFTGLNPDRPDGLRRHKELSFLEALQYLDLPG